MSYMKNLASRSGGTGQEEATAGKPAPQDRLEPRWRVHFSTSSRSRHVGAEKSKIYPKSGKMSTK